MKDLEKEPSKCKGVKGTKVNEALNKVGKRLLFLFDYGDKWHFIIQLKGIVPAKKGAMYLRSWSSWGRPRHNTQMKVSHNTRILAVMKMVEKQF
jgi:hypothetical protein